jgi:hypothetical protein
MLAKIFSIMGAVKSKSFGAKHDTQPIPFFQEYVKLNSNQDPILESSDQLVYEDSMSDKYSIDLEPDNRIARMPSRPRKKIRKEHSLVDSGIALRADDDDIPLALLIA